jgi:hypothetical protein
MLDEKRIIEPEELKEKMKILTCITGLWRTPLFAQWPGQNHIRICNCRLLFLQNCSRSHIWNILDEPKRSRGHLSISIEEEKLFGHCRNFLKIRNLTQLRNLILSHCTSCHYNDERKKTQVEGRMISCWSLCSTLCVYKSSSRTMNIHLWSSS